MDKLLTAEEVANIFQIDITTVHKMVKEGKLQRVDLGIKSYRFNKDYINALCQPRNDNKTWNEIRLEKEIERLKMQLDKLKGDLGAITSLSTNWLRESQ